MLFNVNSLPNCHNVDCVTQTSGDQATQSTAGVSSDLQDGSIAYHSPEREYSMLLYRVEILIDLNTSHTHFLFLTYVENEVTFSNVYILIG